MKIYVGIRKIVFVNLIYFKFKIFHKNPYYIEKDKKMVFENSTFFESEILLKMKYLQQKNGTVTIPILVKKISKIKFFVFQKFKHF